MIKITLSAVKPSYAIGSRYRLVLAKMINLMVKDVNSQILDNFVPNVAPKLATDSSPTEINNMIDFSMINWDTYFEFRAKSYSEKFITEVVKDVDLQLLNSFKKSSLRDNPQAIGEFLIRFSKSNEHALRTSQALIEFNTGLIKSIPSQYQDKVTNLVNEALSQGKGKTWLAKNLQSLGQITKNRALLVSRDQLRKATSAIDNTRRINLGITKAIWRHSRGDKEPRKSHLAAAGTEYDISKGCYIDGEYIQVGEKINCTCYSESVIELE